MTTLPIRAVMWRLGLFAVAMLVLLVVIVQAITRPVDGETGSYTAEFTDVSGLKTGDDVRMFGVSVGKVAAIERAGTNARVTFTVQRDRPIYDSSVLAIRYQSLTGQRYVDVRQPDRPGATLPPGAALGVANTVPSFDITQLFNGLQPVIAEFSPGALNQFTESVLAVIEGNGSGIGPALDAIEELSRYTSDRQAVIATIVANLHVISTQVGGRSPHLVTLMEGLADVVSAFRVQLDGLLDFAAAAPSAMGPLNRLMETLGFTERANPDLMTDLRLLFPDPEAAMELLGRLPGLLQALSNVLPPAPGAAGPVPMSCSKGAVQLPQVLSVLVAGQRIAICNG
ncbi:phospholipid/cholesterol/gamma-HCH transport system substrate-binding protein [Nocardia amikacinitolerans]|uniref:Phospholipid/cholesterol/gamma-HCH transport system substrate-binding protein n=1 Tax=Nocardia amikacinitolerans TaxID=756689 RepID=A0A285L0C1_9NOCA|nr:MCE family protein [Nocardia amikacinitolerans]SNY77056.1 phospholipid/cholesterol/gamma-HCH transport system substrate-binding protein [Nocardia amikacinitolerans]